MPTPSLTHTAVTVCPQTIIQLRVEGTKQCVSRQVIDANLPDPNGYVTKDLLNAALKSGVADGIFLQYKQSFMIVGDPLTYVRDRSDWWAQYGGNALKRMSPPPEEPWTEWHSKARDELATALEPEVRSTQSVLSAHYIQTLRTWCCSFTTSHAPLLPTLSSVCMFT